MRDTPQPKISKEWAEALWRGFLKRTKEMSYEEAQRELPYALFERFKEIYPDRCPPPEEKPTPAPVQMDLPKAAPKPKKPKKHENQLDLFGK